MSNLKAETILDDTSFTTRIAHHFIDGISHEESLLQLPFEHNCMNWIFGHIVTNRSHVLETLGISHEWAEAVRTLYHQDTPPIKPGSPAIKIETLVRCLDESLDLMVSLLTDASDAFMEETYTNYRGEKTRYEHISSFNWHETFHLGQLEILQAFIQSRK
ncbi:MAG: hypothetical protein JXA13_12715 [Anaerolineales bacterium]|nr:hypothetical protein [Anaerolineales bacterium]